ncbi:MAG: AAA family ATPase, partial [Clostridia bacterium]|nr:AAA family ATPase [Clostridia bacterium]
MIARDKYLDQLIGKMNNGKIKIVTGIRRCGKSVLLNELFYDYLLSHGISDDHIIRLSLEDNINAKYRNPLYLDEYIRSLIVDALPFYVLLDEIQNVVSIKNPWIDDPDTDDRIGFPDVLMGLMKIRNVDLYVTGSNSKMLSTDVITQFRDRGDEIHLYPLSFKEFY